MLFRDDVALNCTGFDNQNICKTGGQGENQIKPPLRRPSKSETTANPGETEIEMNECHKDQSFHRIMRINKALSCPPEYNLRNYNAHLGRLSQVAYEQT